MIGESFPWTLPPLDEDGHPFDWQDLCPYNASSDGATNSFVLSGFHALYGLTVNNTKAAAQYLLFFDATSLPADGAVPTWSATLPASSDREFLWIPPRYMRAGIVICNSSTFGTKTIGSADCWFDVQYR